MRLFSHFPYTLLDSKWLVGSQVINPATIGFGWDNFGGTPYFAITLKDTFETWVKTYHNQISDPAPNQKPKIIPSSKTQVAESEHLLKITYTKGREIVLNDIFLIGKPDFNGENDNVFDYLFKHPNKMLTKNEIEKAKSETMQKTFHKIVENLLNHMNAYKGLT